MITWLIQISTFSVYASYLFFQLSSHKGLYQDDNEEIMESKKYAENPFKFKKFRRGKQATEPQYADTALVSSPPSSPQPQARFLTPEAGKGDAADPESGQAVIPTVPEEEIEEPQMSVAVSIGLLVIVTVVSVLVICALDGEGNR
jgi:Ca2+:H+ antiporter